MALLAAQEHGLGRVPRWRGPEFSTAPARSPPRMGLPRVVTTTADICADAHPAGTRTKRTLMCKWKAVIVNAQDAKAGARHASQVTSALDGLAFEQRTAGWMPLHRSATATAEASVDMAVLIHELGAIQQLLKLPVRMYK